MLAKDPNTRLWECTREKIEVAMLPSGPNANLDSIVHGIFDQANPTIQIFEEVERQKRTRDQKEQFQRQIAINLDKAVKASIIALKDKKLFHGFKVMNINLPVTYGPISWAPGPGGIAVSYREAGRPNCIEQSVLYILEGEAKLGYFLPIYLLVRMQNDDQAACVVSVVAMMQNPLEITMAQLLQNYFLSLGQMQGVKSAMTGPNTILQLPTLEIFSGTTTFDDDFQGYLTLQFVRVIKQSLKAMLPFVNRELDGEPIRNHQFKPIIIDTWDTE